MNIIIGIWIIPTLLTIMAFIIAHSKTPKPVGFMGNAIEGLVNYTVALVSSLVVWLIYAFLT